MLDRAHTFSRSPAVRRGSRRRPSSVSRAIRTPAGVTMPQCGRRTLLRSVAELSASRRQYQPSSEWRFDDVVTYPHRRSTRLAVASHGVLAQDKGTTVATRSRPSRSRPSRSRPSRRAPARPQVVSGFWVTNPTRRAGLSPQPVSTNRERRRSPGGRAAKPGRPGWPPSAGTNAGAAFAQRQIVRPSACAAAVCSVALDRLRGAHLLRTGEIDREPVASMLCSSSFPHSRLRDDRLCRPANRSRGFRR